MKNSYFILLFVLSGFAAFPQEVKFKLTAAANYPIIRDEITEQGTDYFRVSSSTNYTETMGAKMGGSFLIKISGKFSVETGLQANLIRFQKTYTWLESVTTKLPSMPGYSDPGSWSPYFPGQAPAPANSSPEPTPGNTAIVYVDLPQVARFTLYKNIQLKAGFTTSLLTFSKQYQFVPPLNRSSATTETSETINTSDGTYTYVTQTFNRLQGGSYKEETSGNGLSSVLFSLNAGVTLKATEHVGIELDYATYLSPIYEASALKQKYNLFSLGSSYTF